MSSSLSDHPILQPQQAAPMPKMPDVFYAKCGECLNELAFPVSADGLCRIGPGHRCPKCGYAVEPCVVGGVFSPDLESVPADKAANAARITEATRDMAREMGIEVSENAENLSGWRDRA